MSRESAVAAMLLVEALDAGPVAALEHFAIAPDDDAGAVYERALGSVCRLWRVHWPLRPAGRLATVPQVGDATYAAKITAADRLLDPARPARELHDRVRALSPHIGARLRARRRAAHDLAHARARGRGPAPGALERDGDAVLLGCGDGRAGAVRAAGAGTARRMPAADWLRGLRGALPVATGA